MNKGAHSAESGEEGEASSRPLLDQVKAPVASADIALLSGRSYELRSDGEGDRLTIRGRGGEVLLRIGMTEAGPVLSFSGADIELSASRSLKLSAGSVDIRAERELQLQSGGALVEKIGGHHHTQVKGEERLEASALQMQANSGSVEVKAMRRIALDGEHIGLNDEPLPQPFGWSAIGEESKHK